MEYFENLIFLLLETPLKNSIDLYFKMIDYELTEKQREYFKKDLQEKIKIQELKKEIQNSLCAEFEEKITDTNMKFNKIINDKDQQIKSLNKDIEKVEQSYKSELLKKQSIIDDLKLELDTIQKDFSQKKSILTEQIESLKLKLNGSKNEIDKKENKIKELSDKLNLKLDDFNIIAHQEWIEGNRVLIQERENIKLSIDSLCVKKKRIIDEIRLLDKSKLKLENSVLFIEDKAIGFIDNMKNIIQEVDYKSNKQDDKQKLLKIESIKLTNEVEETNEKSDYIYDLQTNLEISGISNEYSHDVAQYIYAIFSNKMSLLIVGPDSRKIAHSVSYVTCGASADIISLPLGYSDSNELISVVNSMMSKVVLIENAVDSISESVYLPLVKQNEDKFIIFSIESNENIQLMSMSILNYMMILDIDPLITYGCNEELLSAVANQDIFNMNIELSDKKTNLRYLKGLDNVVELSKSTKLKISEIMCIIDKLDSRRAMYDLLAFTINLLSKFRRSLDELINFAKDQEFDPNTYKMLQSVLGVNFDD
ncbi:MAG: hypothetical protein KAX49_04860 [Halanaerobiales bacterium]|nr:hypothetical protein [Halanaerobiales bacterium]